MVYSPANAVYEILIGVGCLGGLIGAVITIPFIVSMLVTSKEDAERQNQSS